MLKLRFIAPIRRLKNSSGLGYGMQGCSGQGQFYYNESTGMVASKLPSGCLALAQQGAGPQVVLAGAAQCTTTAPGNGWKRGDEVPGPPGRASRASLQSVALPGQVSTHITPTTT